MSNRRMTNTRKLLLGVGSAAILAAAATWGLALHLQPGPPTNPGTAPDDP